VIPERLPAEEKNVMRQAFAGMLWSKQFYKYDVRRWLDGDPLQAPPPAARKTGRNSDWRHVFNADILSMPGTSRSTASSCRSWTRSSRRTSSC
jgi:hypothetical protein